MLMLPAAAAARMPLVATPREQEYLLRAIESGACIASREQFFLWAQGQLQALLPHRMLVALWIDPAGRLARCECLHAGVRDAQHLADLVHPQRGLVVRLARVRAHLPLAPCWVGGGADPGPALSDWFAPQIARIEPGPALLYGSGPLAGGSAFLALLGMRQAPAQRTTHFLELLLPCLLLALQRTAAAGAPAGAAAPPPAAALSGRELQIAHWVREGKSNAEIGALLGISALTVKSHLQKIFRKLGVHTRAQVVARTAAAAVA